MLGTLDLCGVHEPSSDLFTLRVYLQQLVNQPFLLFRFSYGDELSIHLGPPLECAWPGRNPLVKGSFILGARASSWFLRTESPPAVILGISGEGQVRTAEFAPVSAGDLEKGGFIREGARVLAAEPFFLVNVETSASAFGCTLAFNDGATFQIRARSAEDLEVDEDGEPIADWEVFTPYDRYLQVGPGPSWSYLSSRAPA